MKTAIICWIVVILLVIVTIYCYIGVKDNHCPLCGSSMHYEGTVIKGDKNSTNTYYRYVCDAHSWHIMDLFFRVDGH